MASPQEEQASAYRKYFEAVKEFNAVNQDYIRAVSDAYNNRQMAIEKAGEIHINPLLANIREIQIASVVGGILALVFLFSNQTAQAVNSLLIIGGVGLGLLFVFLWTSNKNASLISSVREAKENIPSTPGLK